MQTRDHAPRKLWLYTRGAAEVRAPSRLRSGERRSCTLESVRSGVTQDMGRSGRSLIIGLIGRSYARARCQRIGLLFHKPATTTE